MSHAPSPKPPDETSLAPPSVGQVIAGKYSLERTLGSSGMGIVFLARHLEIDQRVAVKFLLEKGAKDATSLARFKREAKAMARIKSDRVVRVVDFGNLSNAMPYIVMEYLDGSDLSAVMRERGALPIPLACQIALQTCEALVAAHSAGVVHRDLKPSNIFLSSTPDDSLDVKVIDFGIAKLTDPHTFEQIESITHSATLIGSPRYMSPEQVNGKADIDHRVDLWALGIILHEMVSGRRAFEADGVGQLLAAITVSEPTPLEKALPGAPAPLCDLVRAALVKDPSGRIADALEFARRLAPFAGPEGAPAVARIERRLRRPPSTITASGSAVESGPYPAISSGSLPGADDSGSGSGDVAPPSVQSSSTSGVAVGAAPDTLIDAPTRIDRPSSRIGILVAVGAVVALLALGGVGVVLKLRGTPTAVATPAVSSAPREPVVETGGGPSIDPAPPPTATVVAAPSASVAAIGRPPALKGSATAPVAVRPPPTLPSAKPIASAPAAKPAPTDLFNDPK